MLFQYQTKAIIFHMKSWYAHENKIDDWRLDNRHRQRLTDDKHIENSGTVMGTIYHASGVEQRFYLYVHVIRFDKNDRISLSTYTLVINAKQ